MVLEKKWEHVIWCYNLIFSATIKRTNKNIISVSLNTGIKMLQKRYKNWFINYVSALLITTYPELFKTRKHKENYKGV